jgi:AraC-like DNA-binding protein
LKPILEHLPVEENESFVVKNFDYEYYPTPWHYHPEYEIVLVTESTGKRFIGDKISDFAPGNLALLGPNLPHLYRCDPPYYVPDSGLRASSIVVHFLEKSIGADFLRLPQAEPIRVLLQNSVRGLEITGMTNRLVSRMLHDIVGRKGLPRLMLLLEILHVLAESHELTVIASPGTTGQNEKEADRLNRVFEFVMQNFQREIRIAEVADLVHLTETAFSRYFRQRTRKTFTSFLNEIRLGHASKLLLNEEKSVAEICYESGFNNLSNFNRQFRSVYHASPLEFRKQYLRPPIL